MTEQLDSSGRLRHLLTLEGLPREVLLRLLDRAQALREALSVGAARVASACVRARAGAGSRIGFARVVGQVTAVARGALGFSPM